MTPDSVQSVRQITAEETLAVRLPVLRPDRPRESAVFPGDDAPETRHLGAFAGGRLVGVASIFRAAFPDRPEAAAAWQLRGMATLEEVRGVGLGRALLEACIEAARESGGDLLWCNARTGARAFYERHGLRISGEEFDIPDVGPHFRMWLPLGNSRAD